MTVSIVAAGYATTERVFSATRIESRLVEPFPMIAGCYFEGRVVDHRGRPSAGAEVRVNISGSPRPDWIAQKVGWQLPSDTSFVRFAPTETARVDHDGWYRLGPLVPFAEVEWVEVTDRVTGQRLRHGPHRLKEPGQDMRLDLSFPGLAGALEGKVTLNGEPLRARIAWRQSGGFGTAISEKDGGFRVEGIPPGHTVIEVSLFRPRLTRSFDVVIGAGATTRRDLAVEVDTSSVSGKVTDYEGRPLGGVPVQASSTDPDHLAGCRTGPDGRFRIGFHPRATSLKVVAGSPRQAVTKFDVAPGSEGLEFVLNDS